MAAEKRPKMKRPMPISDLLESAFSGKPVQKRLRDIKVWQVWEEAVGAQIASKASPASIRDGVLTLRVKGSAWMQQLSLMKHDIIFHLNSIIGEQVVSDLVFKQGTINKIQDDLPEASPEKRQLSKHEKESLEEIVSPLKEQELRDAFISLFSSQLADSPRK
jgi:hypothetical protein